eukprot:4966355-Alexandrium_andersonii.AAC.1
MDSTTRGRCAESFSRKGESRQRSAQRLLMRSACSCSAAAPWKIRSLKDGSLLQLRKTCGQAPQAPPAASRHNLGGEGRRDGPAAVGWTWRGHPESSFRN